MDEQTMVERVARAICAADVLAPEPDAPIYIGIKSAKAWEARQPIARAAIKAMREPDPNMLKAAGKWWEATLHNSKTGWENGEIIYLAMIDAALAEERHEASPPKA